MKPITGSVVSSRAISLSKSASVLSCFVSSETGSHQDISAYLRRASEAFDELVMFHRGELEAKRESSGRERKEEEVVRKKKKKRNEAAGEVVDAETENNPNLSGGFERVGDDGVLDFQEGRSERRVEKRVDERGGRGGNVLVVPEEDGEKNSDRRNKKKMRKWEEDVKEGYGGGIEEQSERHHEKKRKK